MKLLLFAVHILFASLSFAQVNNILATDESVCGNKNELQQEAATLDRADRKYVFNVGAKSFTIKLENGTSETFTLNQLGKNAYLAIADVNSTTELFWVTTNETMSEIEIQSKDSGGHLCKGGLVITQVSEVVFEKTASK